MTSTRLLAAALALAAAPFALPGTAQAASSYDACTGFIASLPATISTQGVWCFNKDLATSLASGHAITIATNNVTIDCNGFKLGGLGAGLGTLTYGVFADGRSNATIRDCNIRGFIVGAQLGDEDSTGHRIEGNRFEGNTAIGIVAQSTGGLIRDNVVVDTGGTTAGTFYTVAIVAADGVDVIGNQIAGVDGATSATGYGIGILLASPAGVVVERNRISGITYLEGGAAGVLVESEGLADIRDNSFVNAQAGPSVVCNGTQFLYANALMMGEPSGTCQDGGDNYGWSVVGPL